ncbi:hypothetical protein DPEC_G00244550 [Dallia pectoralis]|uniref:Uncharacterized protein n=1 Tax=Dallia pectoralis TaxID=75939 RepID=A0ACC2FVS2_DALPE|nr:hypothetical protein DPEC_G00244550 [Dallia pectoralis]
MDVAGAMESQDWDFKTASIQNLRSETLVPSQTVQGAEGLDGAEPSVTMLREKVPGEPPSPPPPVPRAARGAWHSRYLLSVIPRHSPATATRNRTPFAVCSHAAPDSPRSARPRPTPPRRSPGTDAESAEQTCQGEEG